MYIKFGDLDQPYLPRWRASPEKMTPMTKANTIPKGLNMEQKRGPALRTHHVHMLMRITFPTIAYVAENSTSLLNRHGYICILCNVIPPLNSYWFQGGGYALPWAWKCNKIKGICCLLTEYKTASNPTSSFNLQALGSRSATREIAKDMIEIKKQ